jgi:hypothetical protein
MACSPTDVFGSTLSRAALIGLVVGAGVGCRVAGGMDANIDPRGDGLIERVISDVAMWEVRADGARDGDAGDGDGQRDGDGDGDGGDGPAADGGAACELLTPSCPARQGCYPFPFEGAPTGDRRCAFVGAGGPSVPCQSQLECDERSICSAAGEPDAICTERCDPSQPRCPIGQSCRPLAFYAGVGTCG